MTKMNNHLKEQLWDMNEEVLEYLSDGSWQKRSAPSFDKQLDSLQSIASEVQACRLCQLGSQRTLAVPGEGSENATLLVVGEGPGFEEDRSGRAFVGKAGVYLDSWLASIGCSRQTNTFIANIVKCRPPNNRDPEPEEAQACLPYLLRQIELIRPQGILVVGKVAARFLLGKDEPLHMLRDKEHRYNGIPTVVTYHPAAVLRNPELRRPVWEDLKRLATLIDVPIAQKKSN
jgi:DNA polymerase